MKHQLWQVVNQSYNEEDYRYVLAEFESDIAAQAYKEDHYPDLPWVVVQDPDERR